MKRGVLETAMIVYGFASLMHFVHNGVYLESYPNLPASITVGAIIGSWLGIASIGVLGYVFYRIGSVRLGLLLIAVYAALGFDGFAHYGVAAMSAHTAAMNLTIWSEAIAGLLLLVVVTVQGLRANRVSPLRAQ